MKKFSFYKQPDQMDCGPTCLRMVAKHFGKNFNLQKLRDLSGINRNGVSLLGISEVAEKIGFRTNGVKLTLKLINEIALPAILHWNQNHSFIIDGKNINAPKAFQNSKKMFNDRQYSIFLIIR